MYLRNSKYVVALLKVSQLLNIVGKGYEISSNFFQEESSLYTTWILIIFMDFFFFLALNDLFSIWKGHKISSLDVVCIFTFL